MVTRNGSPGVLHGGGIFGIDNRKADGGGFGDGNDLIGREDDEGVDGRSGESSLREVSEVRNSTSSTGGDATDEAVVGRAVVVGSAVAVVVGWGSSGELGDSRNCSDDEGG